MFRCIVYRVAFIVMNKGVQSYRKSISDPKVLGARMMT